MSRIKKSINKQLYTLNCSGVGFDSIDEDLFVYIYGKCHGRCEFPLIKKGNQYFINEEVEDVYQTLNCLAKECGIYLDYKKIKNKVV